MPQVIQIPVGKFKGVYKPAGARTFDREDDQKYQIKINLNGDKISLHEKVGDDYEDIFYYNSETQNFKNDAPKNDDIGKGKEVWVWYQTVEKEDKDQDVGPLMYYDDDVVDTSAFGGSFKDEEEEKSPQEEEAIEEVAEEDTIDDGVIEEVVEEVIECPECVCEELSCSDAEQTALQYKIAAGVFFVVILILLGLLFIYKPKCDGKKKGKKN